MATESHVIEVRKATVEDYQDVVDINTNVYQGLDYIPYHYHSLVTDPDFSYYICLVDGEVGAFEGVCLLDDNRSLMTRSARVKDKFQGQGLLAHIRKKVYEDYKDVPGKKNLRCSCTNQIRYVYSKTFRRQNKVLLVERIIQFEEIDVGKMEPVSCDTQDSKTKTISMDHFSHLLEIEAVKNYLFPQNLITDDSWFFDALPSNIRYIGKRSSQVVITEHLYKYLPTSQQTKNKQIEASANPDKGDNCKNDCTQGLLALVSNYFSPSSNLFGINIFGRPTEGREVEEIRWIIESAIVILQALYLDETKTQPAVCVVVPNNKDVSTEIFHEATKPFGLLSTKWEKEFTEQWYFEQDFDYLIKPG